MKRCNKTAGRIHSFESFGTHEGPGIRFVIFMQGCLARCLYCQNPDTWPLKKGKLITAEDVYKKIDSCLPYMRASKGGVTVSGGEPMIQPDFLISLFRICKKKSIHTAIDTSGFYNTNIPLKKINTLIGLTDLFIVDIKAASSTLNKKLTSRDLKETMLLLHTLEKRKKPYWIRYVLVPGLNNQKGEIRSLKVILSGLKHCKKFEFLPYHRLGSHKWGHLGLKYPLKKVPAASPRDIERAQALIDL